MREESWPNEYHHCVEGQVQRTCREHDTHSRTIFPSFRLVGVLVPVPLVCCPLPPNSLLAAEEGVSARLEAACEVEASFPAAGV